MNNSNSTKSGKKSCMPWSDRPSFLAPGMLAKGRGKKLQELYVSKNQSSSCASPRMVNNSKSQSAMNVPVTSKTTTNPFVRHSPIGASLDDRVPFNPTTRFPQDITPAPARNISPPPLLRRDDVEDNTNVEDNVALVSEDGVSSSSGDEDLHIPNRACVPNRVREEHVHETPPADEEMNCNANEAETPQLEEELNNGGGAFKKRIISKTRGRNKCIEIAKLKPGEKLEIEFYNNRAVGKNQVVWSRHLGIIVRDTNMCPLRVHKWKDIEDRQLEHMWRAVTDVFSNDNMEAQREHVLHHMYELWINWRADLKRYNITKPKRTLRQALDHTPNGLSHEEWEWLIKEIYSKESHKKASARNSSNRANYNKQRLHRTGSKPYRQVAWELGAKDGNEPSFLQMFRETHKKGDELATLEITQKYDEIRDVIEKDPSLSHLEVANKVFKSKSKDRIVGFGGGVKAKDLRGPCPTRAELEIELHAARKKNEVLHERVAIVETENEKLQNRLESVESEIANFKDAIFQQFNIHNPST